MPISVECEGCGKNYRLGDDKAGKKFKCKECGEVVSIPEDDEEFADAFEVVEDDEEDDEEEERPRRRSAAKRGGKRGGRERGGRDRAQSSRKRGRGRARDDDDDDDDDRGAAKKGASKGKLIGRIVLYTVLAVALVVVGLDYMEQQKMVKSQDAIIAAIDDAKREPISLEAAEALIVGSPKKEESPGELIFTWGIIRTHKLTLGVTKIIGGFEVNRVNTDE